MAKFTKSQYDALIEAISQGVLRVKYTDKEVTYRDLDEMLKIKDMMEKDLGLSVKGSVRLLAKHSKGLC